MDVASAIAAVAVAVITTGGTIAVAIINRRMRRLEAQTARAEWKHDALLDRVNGLVDVFMASERQPRFAKRVVIDPDTGSIRFVMLYLNDAYTKCFGVTKQKYLGATDFEVWPQTVAIQFYEHDMAVYESRGSRVYDEVVKPPLQPGIDHPTHAEGTFRFRKQYVQDYRGNGYIVGQGVRIVPEPDTPTEE